MNPPPFELTRLQYLHSQPAAELTTAELCELADMLAWCQRNHVHYLECME